MQVLPARALGVNPIAYSGVHLRTIPGQSVHTWKPRKPLNPHKKPDRPPVPYKALQEFQRMALRDPDRTEATLAVAVALAVGIDRSKNRYGYGFRAYGYADMERHTGLKRRALIYAVNHLEAKGWITVSRRAGQKNWIGINLEIFAPAIAEHYRPATPVPCPVGNVDKPEQGGCTTVHGGVHHGARATNQSENQDFPSFQSAPPVQKVEPETRGESPPSGEARMLPPIPAPIRDQGTPERPTQQAQKLSVPVEKGSAPWKAWVAWKQAQGLPGSYPDTDVRVNGRIVKGFYFPTLYPPNHKGL